MMNERKPVILAIALALAGLLLCPCVVSAQERDEDAPRRGRRKAPRPERLQQRIDQLLEEGVSEDDSRVHRLQRLLEWMEQEGEPQEKGRRRLRGPRGGEFGPKRYGPEEMMEFVEQHPELRELMMTPPEGQESSPQVLRRNVRRSGRQISEIMSAVEEGYGDLAEALIGNAKIQFAVRRHLRQYHQAPEESSQREPLRDELRDLVRKQVDADLVVQGLKLVSLRQRLAEQEARLASDGLRRQELVDKKLERLLSGKGERSGRRGGRARRFGPRGAPDRFGDDPDEDSKR